MKSQRGQSGGVNSSTAAGATTRGAQPRHGLASVAGTAAAISGGPGGADVLMGRASHCAAQIRLAVPLVLDAAHEQRTVELDRTLGEQRLVLEEAGTDLLDLERFDLPGPTAQRHPLEPRRDGRGEGTHGAVPE